MLARLQDLHDQTHCLLFLATNHDGQIDNAAKRPGRIDYRLEIRHPSKSRVKKYLNKPSSRLLVDLKLDLTDVQDEKEWDRIKTVICKLLDNGKFEKEINFDPKEEKTVAKTNKTISREELRDPGTIPFRFIEQALKAERRDSGAAERELRKLFTDERSNPPNM